MSFLIFNRCLFNYLFVITPNFELFIKFYGNKFDYLIIIRMRFQHPDIFLKLPNAADQKTKFVILRQRECIVEV